MKKLVYILLVLMMLCACGKEPQNEIVQEQPESSVSESENSSSDGNFENSEEEYKNERKLIIEIEGTEIYTESFLNGTRFEIEYIDGNVPVLSEVPKVELYVVDSEGKKLIAHPFDNFYISSMGYRGAHEEYYTLIGSFNGDHYRYIYKDGKFEEYIFEPAGETGEEYFGYKLIQYHWANAEYRCGLMNSDGEVIIEPLYPRIIVPFEDRFIVYQGHDGMLTSSGEGKCLLTDAECNIIAEYTYVTYKFFDDGSYIGIANVAGGNSVKCYDENGNVKVPGYYFIDKDGKCLSERFEEFNENVFAASSPEDVFTAIDENGNESKIVIENYIIND